MPVVLEAVALGAARRERQHRVEPVKRLYRRLLIDAEHYLQTHAVDSSVATQ